MQTACWVLEIKEVHRTQCLPSRSSRSRFRDRGKKTGSVECDKALGEVIIKS